jgi:transposase
VGLRGTCLQLAKGVGIRRRVGRGADDRCAVDRSDELWELVEPLLPVKERRFRYPGRKRLPDRQALQGILFVLHTGISWTHLPAELGFGSGVTCWRRLDEWQKANVWQRLHQLLLARLRAAGEIEWSRAVVDASHVQAKRGAPRRPEPG